MRCGALGVENPDRPFAGSTQRIIHPTGGLIRARIGRWKWRIRTATSKPRLCSRSRVSPSVHITRILVARGLGRHADCTDHPATTWFPTLCARDNRDGHCGCRMRDAWGGESREIGSPASSVFHQAGHRRRWRALHTSSRWNGRGRTLDSKLALAAGWVIQLHGQLHLVRRRWPRP